ncbi:MAG TPA: L,D-transpeptidase family protein [Brevundimonas sp.]|jgi:murein L,D-transpeptidase YcbB/YkuD|uniref:L,D-transpeptidase family protein n=1 Tax=Brevundimonas sp. TaxID=1871086 RepID=UPI002CE8FE25|nr:L,D-transpeptidase family protein [Brevundimonas sp.]HRH20419.1 L,D-transpeptidase family protein [Brevundimonas sp.]
MGLNRRELTFSASVAAIGGAAGLPQVPPVGPADGSTSPFYQTFNDQLLTQPEALQPQIRDFYEAMGWQPAWTPDRVEMLGRVIGEADRHGLDPAHYLDGVAVVSDPQLADMRLTTAALTYAKVLSEGTVDPSDVEELWEMVPNRVPLGAPMAEALVANRLSDWMNALAPTDIGYSNLSAGYIRYRDISLNGGWPRFGSGGPIRPGDTDSRIPALIQRLRAEGDLSRADMAGIDPATTVYSDAIQTAVRRFQVRHGLVSDGIIGQGSSSALSASAEDRARQIALNLERRRWLNRDLNPERIEVNTAAAIMVYWHEGRPVHSNRVVVGTPANQTPSLEKPFASVVANPPWNVPAGIARNEILPRGAAYLRANNMYVTSDGRVVQRAGPTAALGYVKFELRDSYAIFLHDTPARGVFRNAYRHRSHGCVRVENAIDFARLLLDPNPERLAEFDRALDARTTTRVQTGREISVRLLYWTAFVTGQGAVAFREDVYQRDAALARALGIDITLPRAIDDGSDDPNDVGP